MLGLFHSATQIISNSDCENCILRTKSIATYNRHEYPDPVVRFPLGMCGSTGRGGNGSAEGAAAPTANIRLPMLVLRC